jgi:hypothetical protein
LRLPAVVVDAYNLGDRASKGAFRELIEQIRK